MNCFKLFQRCPVPPPLLVIFLLCFSAVLPAIPGPEMCVVGTQRRGTPIRNQKNEEKPPYNPVNMLHGTQFLLSQTIFLTPSIYDFLKCCYKPVSEISAKYRYVFVKFFYRCITHDLVNELYLL